MEETCEKNDLVRSRPVVCMILLTAALIVGQLLLPAIGVWLAIVLLVTWTAFCAVNAWRCGRVHCYFTAPIFLLGAIAILAAHFGIWQIPQAWIWAFLAIGVSISCGAEGLFGKYRRKATRQT